jgi:hypothetical protein
MLQRVRSDDQRVRSPCEKQICPLLTVRPDLFRLWSFHTPSPPPCPSMPRRFAPRRACLLPPPQLNRTTVPPSSSVAAPRHRSSMSITPPCLLHQPCYRASCSHACRRRRVSRSSACHHRFCSTPCSPSQLDHLRRVVLPQLFSSIDNFDLTLIHRDVFDFTPAALHRCSFTRFHLREVVSHCPDLFNSFGLPMNFR